MERAREAIRRAEERLLQKPAPNRLQCLMRGVFGTNAATSEQSEGGSLSGKSLTLLLYWFRRCSLRLSAQKKQVAAVIPVTSTRLAPHAWHQTLHETGAICDEFIVNILGTVGGAQFRVEVIDRDTLGCFQPLTGDVCGRTSRNASHELTRVPLNLLGVNGLISLAALTQPERVEESFAVVRFGRLYTRCLWNEALQLDRASLVRHGLLLCVQTLIAALRSVPTGTSARTNRAWSTALITALSVLRTSSNRMAAICSANWYVTFETTLMQLADAEFVVDLEAASHQLMCHYYRHHQQRHNNRNDTDNTQQHRIAGDKQPVCCVMCHHLCGKEPWKVSDSPPQNDTCRAHPDTSATTKLLSVAESQTNNPLLATPSSLSNTLPVSTNSNHANIESNDSLANIKERLLRIQPCIQRDSSAILQPSFSDR